MNNIDKEKENNFNNIQVALHESLTIFLPETDLFDRDILSLIPTDEEFEAAGRDPKRLIEYEKTECLYLKCEGYFQEIILKYYNKKLYPLLSQEFSERVTEKMYDEILEFIFPNYLTVLKTENQTIKSTKFPEIKLLRNRKKELLLVINRKRKKLNESIKQFLELFIKQFSPSIIDLSSEPLLEAVEELRIRSLIVMVREYGMVSLLKMSLEEFNEIIESIAISDRAEHFLVKKIIEELENRLSETPLKHIQNDLQNCTLEELKYILGFKKRKVPKESKKFPKRKYLHSLQSGTFIEKPLFKRSNLEPAALGYVVKGALEALLNIEQWQLDEFGRYCFIQTVKNGNCLKFSFNDIKSERTYFDDDLVQKILSNDDPYFWVDLAKVHLLFASYTTTDRRSYLHPLHIDASDIISYLGWDRRNDLNQLEKIEYLWDIVETLGRLKVLFSWNHSGDSYTCSPHPVWRTFVHFEREEDEFGDFKRLEYVVIKLEPGIWTEVFLNSTGIKKTKTLCQWTYLPLDTLQINSYQNNLGARLALYLTSNICIHPNKKPYKVKSLLEKVGLIKSIDLANNDRNKKRDLKAKLIKALKLLKKLGWKIELKKLGDSWLYREIYIDRPDLYPVEKKLRFRRSSPKRIPQPFNYRWQITYNENEGTKYKKLPPTPPRPGDIQEGTKTVLFFNKSYSPLRHQNEKNISSCRIDIKSLKKQKLPSVLRPVTGEQLKAAREKKGFTSGYLASCLNLSLTRLNRIENCDRELNNEELERVCEFFTEEDLFSDDKLLIPKDMLLYDLLRD